MRSCQILLLSALVFVIDQGISAQAQAQGRGRGATDGQRAICVLSPVGNSGISGTVFFVQMGKRVHITGKIAGLTPGKHGFHVHEFGDLRDVTKGESTGGHFNPHHKDHGAPDVQDRHVGDLGNVTANAEGIAMVDEFDSMIAFDGPNSIIGRSIIVHAQPDTFVQPTGGAGGRVGYGVIGWANPKAK